MIAILLLLFIILVLILSIPAVQTSLGKYATKKLNEKYNTNITISKVGLQFNGDVELKGIYVIDHKENNLITIEELNTSIINVKNIYDGKLTFGDMIDPRRGFIYATGDVPRGGTKGFFDDTATTKIYTLALHYTLPIWLSKKRMLR